VLMIARGGEPPSSGSGSAAANGGGASVAGRQPAKPAVSLIGKEIVVGSGGDFATIAAALDYVKKNNPVGREAVQVIKVKSGQTFKESILIDNRDFSFPKRIRLASDGSEPAVLAPPGEGPVVRLVSLDQFEFDGFRLDGTGKGAVLELGGYLTGTKLKNLTIENVTGVGILGKGPSGGLASERLTIEDVIVRGGGGNAQGMLLTGGESTATGHVSLNRLRFFGPMATGVVIDDAVSNVALRESIFDGLEVGLKLSRNLRIRELSLQNNSFYRSARGIVFESAPDAGSDGLVIQRNLFAESATADAVAENPADVEAITRLLTMRGGVTEFNVTNRKEPAANAVDLFSNAGRRNVELSFASTDPAQPNFLAPTIDGPAAKISDGNGAETYAGAIAPQ
nr:hypothetical protein [Planctomycetota bacterium]